MHKVMQNPSNFDPSITDLDNKYERRYVTLDGDTYWLYHD